MNVQELIDKLLEIEDKSKEVVYYDNGCYNEIKEVEEDSEGPVLS